MVPLHRVAALTIAASGLALTGAQPSSHARADGDQLKVTEDARVEKGCAVRGVWELVAVAQDGKDQPLAGFKQMKVLTDRHWMWIGHAARRDTLPLKTEIDSLRATQVGGGAGTYATSGAAYLEHIDLFAIP